MSEKQYGDTEVLANGAAQSFLGRAFHLIPAESLIAVSEILYRGATKYGANNWQGIPIEDHLNHALNHIILFLHGDKSENHLGNALCRLMFAYWCKCQEKPEKPEIANAENRSGCDLGSDKIPGESNRKSGDRWHHFVCGD